MNEPVLVMSDMRRLVETRDFAQGVKRHTDAVGRYVKKFLEENGGLPNEKGRKWSLTMCAEIMGVPRQTLQRWVGKVPDGDEEPRPYTGDSERVRVRESTARSVMASPEERREVLAALPPEVRDEVRADLMAVDLPASNRCHHCPAHCPEGGH